MRTLRSITNPGLRINLIIPVGFAIEVCAARIPSNSHGSSRRRSAANTVSNIVGVSFPVLVLRREQW